MLSRFLSWFTNRLRPPSERVVTDEVLGTLTARVSGNRSEWCSWHGVIERDGQPPILLDLGGNSDGPEPHLLDELRHVVANLDAVHDRASDALRGCAPEVEVSDCFISSISSWDEIDEVFEVRFEFASGATPNIETTWPPDQPVAHRIVIGRNYRAEFHDGEWRPPPVKVHGDHPSDLSN